MLITLLVPLLTLYLSACATLPRHASPVAQLNGNAPRLESAVLLNINYASARELEELPGVGQVIAERIIAHRQEYGPFRRAEHLMMVPGMSDRKFREMRPMIVVE